ncbi:MAG: alpha/beta hydrolase [Patescibacteria group bacterium]|nr:alpha/beta hydrolase [Patescibacteria group bacterium]
MAQKISSNPANYIQPLNINRLEGRVLRMPAPNTRRQREILLLYGSHSSLERMFTLATELNRYGPVTMPDWPGFGGMDSLFKIGKKPDVDTMADYLAAFVKLRYRRSRFTIVGMSYGFVVATRMVQRYPELAAKVDFVVSIVGFARHDDFIIKRRNFIFMRQATRVLKHRAPAMIASSFNKGPTVGAIYMLMAKRHVKMKDADAQELKRRIDFEKILWRINDLRTYFYTGDSMLRLDLCDKQTPLSVYHVAVQNDQYFDNKLVEQHLAVIYARVTVIDIKLGAHMPTIVATAKEVAPFIPNKLRRLLAAA